MQVTELVASAKHHTKRYYDYETNEILTKELQNITHEISFE